MANNIYPIEGVSLIYRNFAGNEDQYNAHGAHTFNIQLDPEQAVYFEAEGFNVKYPKPNDEIDPKEDRRLPRLEIKIANKHMQINPQTTIVLVDADTGNQQRIDTTSHSQLAMLDSVDVEFADVVIRAFDYDVNGRQGRSAYLNAIYITFNQTDPFANKYANM